MFGKHDFKIVMFFIIKGTLSAILDCIFKIVMIWSAFQLMNELL